MKHWKTTEAGAQSVERGTGKECLAAARETLTRRNGGLPSNLHMASRVVLLRLIKELNAEVIRLRATQANTAQP